MAYDVEIKNSSFLKNKKVSARAHGRSILSSHAQSDHVQSNHAQFRACLIFDHGTDRDYFLGDSKVKIVSIVILYGYF